MKKKFKLSPSEIKPLAVGYGACIASDKITIDGERVGYMYREQPSEGVDSDSGWRFFSGQETQQYADEPDNFSYYNINTIVNHDKSIIPLLSAPVGSAYGKNEQGEFVEEPMPGELDA
jgi:hypothetical protein